MQSRRSGGLPTDRDDDAAARRVIPRVFSGGINPSAACNTDVGNEGR